MLFRVLSYNVARGTMEFLNRPMSEFWKSTKQTFSEIMDFNDSVIGKRQTQAANTANGTGSSPSDAGGTPGSSVDHEEGEIHRSGHGSGLSPDMLDSQLMQVQDSTMEHHSPAKPSRREKNHSRNYTSKTKRPVSEDIYQKKLDETAQSSTTTTSNPKQNSRHSISNPFGKINFRSLNMMNLTKSDPSSKKTHHGTNSKVGASTPTGMVRVSREMKPSLKTTSNLEQTESDKSMRKHRTHSHSRSNQGFSEGLHFRSNSTDRASVMKLREKKGEGRHSYHRSASDEGALSDQGTQRDEEEDSDDLSTEKVKTKFLSMWNNMKYGWTVKTRTAFSLAKPIWVLGKTFLHRPEDLEDERLPGIDTVKSPAMELFKREFSSLIWLTYRREFPQLAGSSYTTDCGWGCMLRSGQMMLAQALVQHFLRREWNYYNEQTNQEQRFHHEIVRWFGDQPDDMSPFSLHRLVEIGKSSGKKAGDWYGPASVAHIFKEAMDKATELNPLLEQVSVYVAQDCTIYKQDVLDLCKRKRPRSLQPVYSDQESTSSSPISPSTLSPNIPNRTPSPTTSFRTPIPQTVEPSVNMSTHSAVVHSPMLHSPMNTSIVNGTTEEVVESHQSNGQRPAHAQTTRNSDTNGTQTKVLDPPPDYPSCCTVSNTNQPKRKPRDATCPPLVSPKPSRHLLRNGNGHEQSSQGGDDTRLNDHQGVSRNPHDDIKPSEQVTSTPPKEVTLRTQTESSPWCALVILVPVRLGGDEVNPIYVNSIQKLFTLDCCIGIMGGRPRHSLYYVGFQEEKLIHLDPHYCQPFVDMRTREFSLSSFHCMSPRKMAIAKMDPSCTVGFYLRTEEDFHSFCEIIPEIVQSPSLNGTSGDYPMFILRDGKCQDWNSQHVKDTDKPERYLRVRHVDHNGQLIAPVRETEDFVFLDS